MFEFVKKLPANIALPAIYNANQLISYQIKKWEYNNSFSSSSDFTHPKSMEISNEIIKAIISKENKSLEKFTVPNIDKYNHLLSELAISISLKENKKNFKKIRQKIELKLIFDIKTTDINSILSAAEFLNKLNLIIESIKLLNEINIESIQDFSILKRIIKLYGLASEFTKVAQLLSISLKIRPKNHDLKIRFFVYNLISDYDPRLNDKKIFMEEINNSLEEINNIGVNFLNHNYLKEAEKIFRYILEKFPEYDVVINNLGETKYRQGMKDDAFQYFSQAVQKNSQSAIFKSNCGKCLIDFEKYDDAIDILEDATKIKPDYVDSWIYLGNAYALLEKFQEAEKIYLKGLQKNPKNSILYYNLGYLNRKQNHFQEAIQYYKKSLEIDPKDINTLNNLGYVYQIVNNTKEAEKNFLRSIEIGNRKSLSWNNLGTLYMHKKEFKKAIYYFNVAKQIEPEHPGNYINLINYNLAIHNNKKAFEMLQKADELDIKKEYSSLIFHAHGEILLKKGDYSEAEKKFLKANEIAPTQEETYIALANLYHLEKKDDKEFRILKKLIKINPRHIYGINHLSYLYFKKQEYTKAIFLLSHLIKEDMLGDKKYEILDTYGEALYYYRKYEEARIIFQKILKIDRNNYKVKEFYAETCWKAALVAKSLNLTEEYIKLTNNAVELVEEHCDPRSKFYSIIREQMKKNRIH